MNESAATGMRPCTLPASLARIKAAATTTVLLCMWERGPDAGSRIISVSKAQYNDMVRRIHPSICLSVQGMHAFVG